MKTALYAWVWAISSICFLFLLPAHTEELPDALPELEVTALATCKDASKVRAILNDRVVKEGDLFEVTADGKLGARIVKPKKPAKGVKPLPVKTADRLLEIGKITKKGVTVFYSERETKYMETKIVPLKRRGKDYGLEK